MMAHLNDHSPKSAAGPPRREQPPEASLAEIHSARRAYAALSACTHVLVRASDEQALLDQICQVIIGVAGYCFAWVGYADHGAERLVIPQAQAGYEEGYLNSIRVTWADDERGSGPTGTAIRTGRPSIAQNLRTEPRYAPWRAEAERRGYGSSIALPLRGGGATLGALNIYAEAADAFSESEVALLSDLADNLAYGIIALRTRAERERASVLLSRYQLLAAHGRDIVLFVRADDGRIMEANAAACAAYGYSHAELLTLTIHNLRASNSQARISAQMQAAAQGGILFETIHRRKDGRTFPVEVSSLGSDSGGERLLVSIIRDISDRKKTHALQIDHERLLANRRLIATVAHELNTPLLSARSCLYIARQSVAGEAAHYLQMAEAELERVGRIVGELLGLHRQSAEGLEPVVINELIERVLLLAGSILRDNHIVIERALAPDLPLIYGRPDQLRQLILNLIANAAEAMPDGGVLQVSTGVQRGSAERPGAARRLICTFSDTGHGIAPDMAGQVFEPFITTRPERLGLGLAVSREIAESHGGSLTATSLPGRGSRFILTIPIDAPITESEPPHGSPNLAG